MNNWFFINDGGNKKWIENIIYQIDRAAEIYSVPVSLQCNLVSYYWIINFYAYKVKNIICAAD
jgi:hypothetical protein